MGWYRLPNIFNIAISTIFLLTPCCMAAARPDSSALPSSSSGKACSSETIELRNSFTQQEKELLKDTWPMDLIEDPARQAKVVHTPAEFLQEVLLGDHVNQFVVFPNGIEAMKLGWKENIPGDIQSFLQGRKTGVDILRGLLDRKDLIVPYDWRMDLYGFNGRPNRTMVWSHAEDFSDTVREIVAKLENATLKPEDVYIAEVSRRKYAPHPISGMKTIAIFSRDVEHLLGPYAKWVWHWDSKTAGLFLGSRFSGTGLHVDQTLWSDVGRNFQGHKLVAAWPPGKVGAQAMEALHDDLFRPPLDEERLQVLRTAAKVTLLRPGDMYLFSGGVAHSALCLSKDELCMGSYESIVTLNPALVELWKHKSFPNRKCDGIYCIGDEATAKERYRFINQSVATLESAAKQSIGGGPAAQTSGFEGIPDEWNQILETLNSMNSLYENLREFYSQAVGILMRNKHFRRHVPSTILQAAGLGNHSDPSLEDEYEPSVQCTREDLMQKLPGMIHFQFTIDAKINVKVVSEDRELALRQGAKSLCRALDTDHNGMISQAELIDASHLSTKGEKQVQAGNEIKTLFDTMVPHHEGAVNNPVRKEIDCSSIYQRLCVRLTHVERHEDSDEQLASLVLKRRSPRHLV